MRNPISSPARAMALLACLALVVGCKKEEAPSAGGGGRGGAVPVTVAEVVKREIPVVLRAIGNVRPSATVSVKPRVGGLIAAVQFEEGADVKAGDILFTIDAKPFEVALAQAKAALAQLREQAANAQQQAQRYVSLGKTGGVAKEQLDQFQSTARATGSGAEAAEAAVKEAEIQLGYTSIKSPIAGRTGRRMVDAGNVVVANTTELVVVNQVAPVEVSVAIPEKHLADLARYMAEGALKVVAKPASKQSVAAMGELTFVDNAVNATTGTIDVKATFPNEDHTLWPGQFADVTITLTTERGAIVAPSAAVQIGQNGQYVFVVTAEKTVELRPIELARTVEGDAVIRKGLAVGESVVIDGHIRLVPGAKVELKPPVGSGAPAAKTAQSGPANPSSAPQP